MGSCVCPCTMVVCIDRLPWSTLMYLSCKRPLPNIALAQPTAQPQSPSALPYPAKSTDHPSPPR
jgi:hypothetical protein